MPRQCMFCSREALLGSSRCRGHGGRKRDPRTTSAKGLGADHQALRLQALRRAGADESGLGGACEACGQPGVVGNPLEGGHVLPRALGGQNQLANYVAVCRKCNRGEGSRIRKTKAALEKRREEGL
jgi:5-methylcytosine-specific restriction endonuclease McrA